MPTDVVIHIFCKRGTDCHSRFDNRLRNDAEEDTMQSEQQPPVFGWLLLFAKGFRKRREVEKRYERLNIFHAFIIQVDFEQWVTRI